MKRHHAFRPSLTGLESRRLPTVGPYPDPIRNAVQAAFVAEAESGTNPVVFLGDSITAYWGNSTVAAPGSAAFTSDFAPLKAANFGIIGDTTSNLLARVEGGDLDGKPKVAVVMIGVNDLIGGATPAQAASGVTSVVQAIRSESPDTRVLLLGVLPTEIAPLNAEVVQFDLLIAGLGNDPGVTFLNPGVEFEAADGLARESLLKDSVHPDAAGYQVLAGAIDATILGLLDPSTATQPRPAPVAASSDAGHIVTTSDATPSTPGSELIPLVGDPSATPGSPSGSTIAGTGKANRPASFATELVDAS